MARFSARSLATGMTAKEEKKMIKKHPTLAICLFVILITIACIGLNAIATLWQVNLIKLFW